MPEKSVFWENTRKYSVPLAAVFVYALAVIFLPRKSHDWDAYCWGLWAELIANKGLTAVYDAGSPVNYLPLYLYVLKLYALLVPVKDLFELSYLLKAFTFLFDIASALMIVSLVPEKKRRVKLFLFCFLNAGFVYNTLIWNQVDGILACFILAAFILAIKQKLLTSALFALLAVNLKLQGIVFMPLLFLLWLPQLRIRNTLFTLLSLPALQTLIILPYLIHGNAANILDVISGSVDYYPSLSMNAFNFWHLIYKGDLMFVKDDGISLAGFSCKQFGLLLFGLSALLVLLPMLLQSWRYLKHKTKPRYPLQQMLLTAALCAFFFFYFNTQMHERYIHPVMLFSTALAFAFGHWRQWLLIGFTYALSLESICHFFFTDSSALVFQPRFLASAYTLGMADLLFLWFRTKPFKKES